MAFLQKAENFLVGKYDSLAGKLMQPLINSDFMQRKIARKQAEITDNFKSKQFLQAGEYENYIKIQVGKSYRNSTNVRFWQKSGRTGLIRELDRALPAGRDLKILCVGCRDSRELNYVQKICRVKNVRGVDLFSNDPRIQVADMHALPFGQEFDALISVDNLEHAYDPQKALGEFKRVVRPGGLIGIEVPVDYPTTELDRHDYKTPENIMELIGLKTLVFSEFIQGPVYRKLRLILQNN